MKPHRNKATEHWALNLIRDDGRQTTTGVHRLVARAWIPIPKIYVEVGLTMDTLTVDHKDEDPNNNNVENLQWMTQRENTRKFNLSAKGREAQKRKARTQGRNVIVRCLDDDEDEIMTYHSKNDFKRAWPTVGSVETSRFPKRMERDGRKYRADVEAQPDLEGEVWKTVPADLAKVLLNGADCSRIRVSSMGRLKSAKGVVRSLMGKTYPQVGVGSAPMKNLLFHRLVAAAFHPEQARELLAAGVPVEDVVADHMNDDSTDQRAANLQWTRRVDNLQFGSGTRKRKRRE